MNEIYLSQLEMMLAINAFVVLTLITGLICLKISHHRQCDTDAKTPTMLDLVISRLNSLLTVKSIVTLILTEVFVYQAINYKISQEFMTVYTVVIAFYFGTQAQKSQDAGKNVKENAPKELDEQKQD